MYRNSDDYSEYNDRLYETNQAYHRDYADPSYYQQEPRSAQPVQPPAPYTTYPPVPKDGAIDGAIDRPIDTPYGGYQPHNSASMAEYRGPASMEGYTADVGTEQREAAKRGNAEGRTKQRGWAGIGSTIVTIGALLLKLKGLAFLLKFGFAGFTAIFSIVVYSLFFGWPFAVGLVVLLFLHEMGHALVMKLKGIPLGGMIFIPMLGAAVTMRQMPQNARDEAEVGIAGPIAGAIASSVCLVLAKLDPHPYSIWAPLAYFGFFMNLFNLIPIVPFDGGRVLAAIDRRIWIIGFIGLLGYQIWLWLNGNFSPWLLLFVLMAATQFWSRSNTSDTPQGRSYYSVPVGTRIVLGLAYFGLAAVLVLGMTISHSLIPGLQ